jgi:hypothetical protein
MLKPDLRHRSIIYQEEEVVVKKEAIKEKKQI